MNEMRKLMETIEQLNEYFVKSGMTVGEVFEQILGMLDEQGRSAGLEFEPDYLRSLGFDDAADELDGSVDEVAAIKLELQPVWDEPAINEEALDLLNSLPHLEASEEYDDEELYMENVVPSFDRAIEIFQEYGASLAEESAEDDFEGPFNPSAEMRERF